MFTTNKISKIIINRINFFNLFFYKGIVKKNITAKIKAYLNIKKNLIFIGRARTGIYLLVKHYLKQNVSKVNNVLVIPYTVPDIIKLVIDAKGVPIYLDFEKKSTFISIKDLNYKVKKFKPKILILTHYHLLEKNFKKIYEICRKNNIILLEDLAISYGTLKRRNFKSDGAIFSFSSFKLLNFYLGGAVTCKNNKVFSAICAEVNNWKRMSVTQYFRQFILTSLYQLLTNKIVFNYFGYYLINRKYYFKSKNFKQRKLYFSNNKKNDSYFTKPSLGFFNEIENKITSSIHHQRHRVKIFKIYNKYLNKISIPQNITDNQINSGSCYNFLIYHKDANFIHKELVKLNYDVGRLLYENLSKFNPLNKNYKFKNQNINDLAKNLIVLPTHKLINYKYATNLAKDINAILKKKNENN